MAASHSAVGAQAPGPGPKSPAGPAADAQTVVARVGGYAITAGEFEKTAGEFEAQYERESGRKIAAAERPLFRRSVLEQLVRQRLLRAEAKRRGIAVSDAEAERFLRGQGDFNPGGRFDAARWSAFTADPGRYRSALTDVKEFLAAQKLFERLQRQLPPSDAALTRRLAEKTLRAELEVAVLDRRWFADGVEVDPDSLRAHYLAMRPRFAQTTRAKLSLAVVGLPESEIAQPSATVLERTRARADSVLRAIKAGASFETAAGSLGGIRDAGSWEAGQETGLFYDDRALGDEALAASPQTVLSRPLRVPSGFALVRVDRVERAAAPPLAQVADSVAHDYLRARRERPGGDAASSPAVASSALRTVCTTWHAALVDTASIAARAPSEGDLATWYQAHASEFARLDPEGKGLTRPPYTEIKDEVRTRWLDKERWRLAEDVAVRIARAWSKGKRDRSAEGQATVWYSISHAREEAPAAKVPQALIDSAWTAAPGSGGVFPGSRGFAVFAVVRRDSCPVPPQMMADRARWLAAERESLEVERGARDYFEAHRDRYPRSPTYHLTYVEVRPRRWAVVDIAPSLVERYYHEHPEEFGQPGEVRVKHLLVHVPPRSDTTAAWSKIQRALAEARAGTPFDSLVRRYSDDPITRDKGGDLGWFRKGMTSPAFEALAFRLAPGELGGPVRSEFGYHLVLGVEKKEEKLSPLHVVRGVAGQKLATIIADSLARSFGDSLLHRVRRVDELRRLAEKRGYHVLQTSWRPGAQDPPVTDPALREDVAARGRPGLLPNLYLQKPSYYVVFVDSISGRGAAEWEEARDSARADYRAERLRQPSLRAAEKLRAELARQVPWDSAAAPWGGGASLVHRRWQPLLGGSADARIDSAVFGSGRGRLAEGQAMVLDTDAGPAVIQLVRRVEGSAPADAATREALRRQLAERAFYDYFRQLKQRYPVRILRPDLRLELPPPPAS